MATREELAAAVLEIRARYEGCGPSAEGQELLSAAVKDLEDIDAKLLQRRERD